MLKTYDTVILGCGEAGIFAGYELIHSEPRPEGAGRRSGPGHLPPQLPHRGRQGAGVHPLPGLPHHVRLRRRGRFLRRQVQLHHRLRRLADRLHGPGKRSWTSSTMWTPSTSPTAPPSEVFSTDTPEAKALARRALDYDLHLLQARCKHLGTENNLRILTNIYEDLQGQARVPLQHRGDDASTRPTAAIA